MTTIHVSKRGVKPDDEVDIELFDIVDYLEDRGVDYSTAGTKNVSAGWIGISCPFCGDHSNHMGINLENNLISCFKCGKRGSVLNIIQAIDNCGFGRAKETLGKFILRDFAHLVKKVRNNAEKTMYPGGVSDNFLPVHDNFLSRRRYDRKFLQQKYDIKAIGPTVDDWKFRILIPVYLNQEIVTYVARDCTGKAEIPYKNAPIEKSVLQAKHCLYGLDEVKDTAIIVEGIFDKWRIGTGAICSFGTQYTDEQISLIGKKNIKRAFILYDSDATDKAYRLAYDLSSVVASIEVIELKDGDPDELTEDEVWELRREIL